MQMQKGFDVVNLHGTASGVIATPYIGENENWWIGNEDTGINARGKKGDSGEIGPQGPKGDQAADMSRIEALEAKYEQLNRDYNALTAKIDNKVEMIDSLRSPFEIGYDNNYPSILYVKNKKSGVTYRMSMIVN